VYIKEIQGVISYVLVCVLIAGVELAFREGYAKRVISKKTVISW